MVSILFKWLMVFSLTNSQGFANAPIRSSVDGNRSGFHPIYMSVTEIENNPKDKTLEISCKIFTDDFEKTLRKTYTGKVELINPIDKTAMNKLVSEYVQKHLQLKVDGKPVMMEFIGYEQQEEGITSYFQVNNILKVKKLDITDNILYEYKSEQISLLHITVMGNRKSTRLVNPEDKVSLEF